MENIAFEPKDAYCIDGSFTNVPTLRKLNVNGSEWMGIDESQEKDLCKENKMVTVTFFEPYSITNYCDLSTDRISGITEDADSFTVSFDNGKFRKFMKEDARSDAVTILKDDIRNVNPEKYSELFGK